MSEFPISPQNVFIYDQGRDLWYSFDGVIKVSHSLTVQLDESPDTKKMDKYVNNAIVQPDKLTLDVIMSDVYTSRGALTNTDDVRSLSAFNVLCELKNSRRKVQVVTSLGTYNDMILIGLSVEENDTMQYGWQGQVQFQEGYEEPKKKKVSGVKDSGETTPLTATTFEALGGNSAVIRKTNMATGTSDKLLIGADAK